MNVVRCDIADEKIVEVKELGFYLDPTTCIFNEDGSETLLDPVEGCRCYQEITSIQREAQEGCLIPTQTSVAIPQT